jgi:site-specific recombinase XerD
LGRHACGYKLANDGHDTRAIQAYLGHRSIIARECGVGTGTVQRVQQEMTGPFDAAA